MLVLTNLALGFHMEHFPGYGHKTPEWNAVLFYHASIGMLVLWITISRLYWRLIHKTPPYPSYMPEWHKKIASLSHGFIYFCIIALPLSGYAHRLSGGHSPTFFGLFTWPVLLEKNEPIRLLTDKVHIVLAFSLLALLSLHLLAVIKHALIDKDNILRRMNPFSND